MSGKNKVTAICILAVLFIAGGIFSFSWFIAANHDAVTDPVTIDAPPVITVLNNETTTLDILNMEGLRVGETYQKVFSVSPSVPNTVTGFKMNLCYTTNLGESADLYAAEYIGTVAPANMTGVLAVQNGADPSAHYYYRKGAALVISGTDYGDGYTTAELAGSVQSSNVGVYKKYRDTSVLYFDSTGTWNTDWTNHFRYRFFVLEVTWPDGPPANLDSKETDIIYVAVAGSGGL